MLGKFQPLSLSQVKGMREQKEGTPISQTGKRIRSRMTSSWVLKDGHKFSHRKRGASMVWIFQGEFSYCCFLKLVDFPHFRFKWGYFSQHHSFLAPNCIFSSSDMHRTVNKYYKNCHSKAKNILHLLFSDPAREKRVHLFHYDPSFSIFFYQHLFIQWGCIFPL